MNLLKKKNLFTIVLLINILFTENLFAEQEIPVAPHEVGVYFKDYFPIGSMSDHAVNSVGGGISYIYHTPWNVPIPAGLQDFLGEEVNVGFSGRIDFDHFFAHAYVTNWNIVNILAGAFVEIEVNNWLIIQPSIEYGLQIDIVKSTRKANGVYVGQSFQLSPTFKFSIPSLSPYGISFEASPLWSIGFEKKHSANYLGLRLGVLYHIGGSSFVAQSTDNFETFSDAE